MTTSASKDTKPTSTRTDSRESRAARQDPPIRSPRIAPPADLVKLQFKVQSSGSPSASNSMTTIANQGFHGHGTSLPHFDRIQSAFGKHDVSHVQTYTDDNAKRATQALQARGYTVGDRVALSNSADLHTEAHEAAHVVQQQHGVQLSGGMGKVGDKYERHADAVADAVVQGRSAESLLDEMAGDYAVAGGDRTAIQLAPDFGKEFASTSVGVETELDGIECALDKEASQTFAYVMLAETKEPLVRITKDMKNGDYYYPVQVVAEDGTTRTELKPKKKWTTHTVELVTYPCPTSDETGIENRRLAIEFLLKHFATRVADHPHKPLGAAISADQRFRLRVENANHIIKGTGPIDQPVPITTPYGGKQATVGVKASQFGTGADADLQLLESAPWYHKEYANDPVVRDLQGGSLDPNDSFGDDAYDVQRVQRAYAYLKSIVEFMAHLVQKHNLYIDTYKPPMAPIVDGFGDPRVKNEWKVLPRTAPLNILNGMAKDDAAKVRKLITNLPRKNRDPKLWAACINYVNDNGPVAGHSINDAKVGGEAALLFEHRALPQSLNKLLPKADAAAAVFDDNDMTQFMANLPISKRTALVKKTKEFVAEKQNEFAKWFVDTHPDFNKPIAYPANHVNAGKLKPVKKKGPKDILKTAAAATKANWVREKYPDSWKAWIA